MNQCQEFESLAVMCLKVSSTVSMDDSPDYVACMGCFRLLDRTMLINGRILNGSGGNGKFPVLNDHKNGGNTQGLVVFSEQHIVQRSTIPQSLCSG